MFDSQQEIRFWCARWAFTRDLFKTKVFTINRGVQQIAMVNYAMVLTAGFTHYFNHRLKQRGGCL